MENNKLFLPIILGTVRQGRESEKVAKLVLAEVQKRPDIDTVFFDPRELNLPPDDEGESLQQYNQEFIQALVKSDGIIIVSPEYNHGYPSTLKKVLDMINLVQMRHKPVGLVGVSDGPFGGVRLASAIQPVIRTLGMISIKEQVNFSNVDKVFDADRNLLEPKYIKRIGEFLNGLVWMANALRVARMKDKQ